MVEKETLKEMLAAADGIIVMYTLFTIVAVIVGAVGVWWGIFAVLVMAILAYGIAPGYPEVIIFFNYVLFALLILIILLTLAGAPGMHILLALMTIVGPLMIISVPIGHILYLVMQKRKEAARAPGTTKKVTPAKVEPTPQKELTPQKEVGSKLSRGFALFCGYGKLKARHAFALFILRTAIAWIIGSVVILILTKVLHVW